MTSLAFTVQDMTCNHCAKTITAALKAADPDCTVYGIGGDRMRVQVASWSCLTVRNQLAHCPRLLGRLQCTRCQRRTRRRNWTVNSQTRAR